MVRNRGHTAILQALTMDIASVAAFILGLVLLWAGAELLVHFGVKLAVRLGISSALVGLIVIAYGTSLPELVVGVIAAVQKRGLIVYGDVVGTNIVNLSFVLGLAAVVGAVTVKREIARLQLPFLAAITALLIILSMDGVLSRLDALAFLVAMGLYLYLTIRSEAQSELEGDIAISGGASLPLLVISIAAGFAILILGARIMVDSAVLIARALGVSDRVIALTIVAAGTSLPEAATAIVAAVRRQAALGLGGLVGSNIFNTLLILGVSGAITPIGLEKGGLVLDYSALGIFTVSAMLFGFTGRIGRAAGALMVLGYAAYIALLIT